jgi:hypothetical protein
MRDSGRMDLTMALSFFVVRKRHEPGDAELGEENPLLSAGEPMHLIETFSCKSAEIHGGDIQHGQAGPGAAPRRLA